MRETSTEGAGEVVAFSPRGHGMDGTSGPAWGGGSFE